MKDVTLDTGTGVIRDSTGIIVNRFDLPPGTHQIPDGHTVEEYPTFEDVLALNWPPEAVISLSKTSIVADGTDSVTVTIETVSESARDWSQASLTIAGDVFPIDLSTGSAQETITTTTTDATITVEVTHPEFRGDTAEIQVNQP